MKSIPANASGFVPASHENPLNPGVLKRVIATRDDLQFGQVQMVNWARLPKGSSFQLHYHEDMQEVFVLLNGHVQMQIHTDTLSMQAGDTVIVDVREVHKMTNVGDCDAEYLVFGISSGQGGKTVVVE
jgi:mannose-6-phosphate isomerase-like protein (cupin superfamily)